MGVCIVRLWNLVLTQVRSLVFRGRRQRELDEELRLHLEQEIAQEISRGLSPEEARRSALRAFGGVDQIKEECRDAWGLRLADELARDTRYAARRLARDWRFSLLAVLILALGIGANTAMFSVVNATFVRPLPFRDAHQLVNIYQNDRDSGQPWATSYPAYEDIAAYSDLYAGTTAVSFPVPMRFSQDGTVRSGVVEYALSNYLAVLGLAPSRGRWFTAEEDRLGAAPVAVVTHRAWTNRFGADPSVVGGTIRVNGVPVTVIGVGPDVHNSGLHAGILTDFWLSVPAIVTVADRPDQLERDDVEAAFLVQARLREGVSLVEAQAAMTALGLRLADDFPEEDAGRGISVLHAADVRIHPQLDLPLNYGASVLMILVGLLLAIACTNLATWLLVRGLSRAKEVSVRLALGATRGQLVRQLLVESTVLAACGGAAGCLLAVWSIRLLALPDVPFDVSIGLDYRVLGFTVLLSLLTGVLFGLAPALKATGVTVAPALRADGDTIPSGRGLFTLKHALVVSQVALSCVLLVWGGMFLQRLVQGQTADLGFPVDRVAFIETDASFAGYAPEQAAVVYEALRDRIAALPGVASATRAAVPPPTWSFARELIIDGYQAGEGEVLQVVGIWAGPRYFDTLQIPLLYGRPFSDLDRPDTPAVAIINETMARRYFGRSNAVGQRFRLVAEAGRSEDSQDRAGFEVIGVVADTRTSVSPQLRPLFYRSFDQTAVATPTVVVRTTMDPASLLQPMQQTLRDLGAELPVIRARTMPQHLADSLLGDRALAAVVGGLGALGLGLASLGLYAVVAFAVSRRAREIGIRMALGAPRAHVMWTVSRNVAALVAVGVTVGLALSWSMVRWSAAMSTAASQGGGVRVRVQTLDLTTLLAVAALMGAVGLMATFFPAQRAAKADPLVALRHL